MPEKKKYARPNVGPKKINEWTKVRPERDQRWTNDGQLTDQSWTKVDLVLFLIIFIFGPSLVRL